MGAPASALRSRDTPPKVVDAGGRTGLVPVPKEQPPRKLSGAATIPRWTLERGAAAVADGIAISGERTEGARDRRGRGPCSRRAVTSGRRRESGIDDRRPGDAAACAASGARRPDGPSPATTCRCSIRPAPKEHLRAAAGLFDVSHMGQIALRAALGRARGRRRGAGAAGADGRGRACAEGRQRYGLFTDDAGGILDDLMFANRGDHLFLVVNAACKAADLGASRGRARRGLRGRAARPRADGAAGAEGRGGAGAS